MNRNELDQSLYKAYENVYDRTKSTKTCQEEEIKKWNEIKNDWDLTAKIVHLLKEYRTISMKSEGKLM